MTETIMKKYIIILVLICLPVLAVVAQSKKPEPSETVVFIHGLWGGAWYWEDLISHFEELGFECHAPEWRYHTSPERDDRLAGTGFSEYIEDLDGFLRKFETPPVVIGHSAGAVIAGVLASRGLADELVLLAPSPGFGTVAPVKYSQWYLRMPGFEETVVKPSLEEAAAGMFHGLDTDTIRREYAMLRYESGKALKDIVWILDLTGPRPTSIDYKLVTCPVLVLNGSEDVVSPPRVVKRIAGKYGVTSRELPGRGHWMMIGQGADEIFKNIQEFYSLE
jgi:non-heme chloroperoxidase